MVEYLRNLRIVRQAFGSRHNFWLEGWRKLFLNLMNFQKGALKELQHEELLDMPILFQN